MAAERNSDETWETSQTHFSFLSPDVVGTQIT